VIGSSAFAGHYAALRAFAAKNSQTVENDRESQLSFCAAFSPVADGSRRRHGHEFFWRENLCSEPSRFDTGLPKSPGGEAVTLVRLDESLDALKDGTG
jgi:hypothetical protein